MSGGPVLLVEDDMAVREALTQTLELADLSPMATGSFVAAKDHITADFPGVILSDIRMPGRDGFHLLAYAQEVDADLPVVLLTGEGDIPMAVRAMEQGAFDFLEKPCAPADLIRVLGRALALRRETLGLRAEQAQAEAGDPAARLIFGRSPQAETLRANVRRAARTGADVLVWGPPGSGVSKVAEVIHLCSPQAQGPFEKRAAAGLDRAALEKVLTRVAHGSLFLDEIPSLPADAQIALAEALEQNRDTRLIAGSTIALTDGMLNDDLFYRLQVNAVRIPALSERPEDIPVLFRRYVALAAEQSGLEPPAITPDHMAALMARGWSGNARSLMSEAMRFVLGLPDDIAHSEGLSLAEQMAQVERSLLISALSRAGGRAAVAAEALQVPRKTFYDKLTRYGLKAQDYKS